MIDKLTIVELVERAVKAIKKYQYVWYDPFIVYSKGTIKQLEREGYVRKRKNKRWLYAFGTYWAEIYERSDLPKDMSYMIAGKDPVAKRIEERWNK